MSIELKGFTEEQIKQARGVLVLEDNDRGPVFEPSVNLDVLHSIKPSTPNEVRFVLDSPRDTKYTAYALPSMAGWEVMLTTCNEDDLVSFDRFYILYDNE